MSIHRNILVVDNFDSFTFNLVHLIARLGHSFTVVRNDALSGVEMVTFSHLLIGPGPGLPATSGALMETLRKWPEEKPLLGVCLGLQALVKQEGGLLENLKEVQHGAQSFIGVDTSCPLFSALPNEINVGRYHSWGAPVAQLPAAYRCVSEDTQGYAMAIQHISRPWFGVQFHPESIMTDFGLEMLRNWTELESPDSSAGQRRNQ